MKVTETVVQLLEVVWGLQGVGGCSLTVHVIPPKFTTLEFSEISCSHFVVANFNKLLCPVTFPTLFPTYKFCEFFKIRNQRDSRPRACRNLGVYCSCAGLTFGRMASLKKNSWRGGGLFLQPPTEAKCKTRVSKLRFFFTNSEYILQVWWREPTPSALFVGLNWHPTYWQWYSHQRGT